MRELSENITTEKEKDITRPIELYDIYLGSQTEVDSNTLFFAVCPERVPFWDIEDTPQDYVSVNMGRSPIKHNMDLAVDYFNVTLGNVDRSMGALIAVTDFRNKRVILRTVFLDRLSSPDDATVLFDGIMDKPSITETSLSVQVVSRLNLKRKTGRMYQLMCGWIFGETRCTFDRSSTQSSGTINAGSTSSVIIDSARTEPDDFWNNGLIHFTSGANEGQKRRVTGYSLATHQISIDIVLLSAITVGDTYDIFQGCDKTLEWCNSAFNNRVNFGGFHTLPVQTPERL